MSEKYFNSSQNDTVCVGGSNFDLFRLSKGKQIVDVCANTLRAYNKDGLPFYRRGKAIFISKTELAQFIRSKSS